MTEVTRHFTATTFVICDGRVLLHQHAKQRLWLPPGGHIDRDELPHEAAKREIEEETGLPVTLHSEIEAGQLAAEMDCGVVPQPAFILVEDINAFHQHIDFIYFAEVSSGDGGQPPEVRAEFSWLTPEELEMEGVPQNVRAAARRALDFFRARLTGLGDGTVSGAAPIAEESGRF
jgi:8-oxo-dGTP pyrophosphatase MutT (NUDIX family)